MNWILEHILGLIIIVLFFVDFYLKWMLYKVFTERVEKPVKEDLKLQRKVEAKTNEALKVKNIEEIFIDHE